MFTEKNSPLEVKYVYIQEENAFKPILFEITFQNNLWQIYLELNKKKFPLKLIDFML